MDAGLQSYWENTQKPWGRLFYRMVWAQLPPLRGGRALDFGSGFGITAAHLAESGRVVAVEPNRELAEARVRRQPYCQLTGGVEQLAGLESGSFDLAVCHNVLEYAPEREEIVRELQRLLKPGGTLSVVKHHHAGRVMQKAVFENALDEAADMLRGGSISVRNFGRLEYYDEAELASWAPGLRLEQTYGVRTFWALQQDNAVKEQPEWQDKMFALEQLVQARDPYRQVAFFHHLLYRK